MSSTHDISAIRELIASGAAREIRQRGGLSLRDASKVMSRAVPTLSRWETGARTPSDLDATRYAGFLFGDQLDSWVRAWRRESGRRRP